jgi:Domain of unknown function (DUF5664)
MSNKNKKGEGVKNDQQKIRWDLVPYDAVNEIAKVLTFGAEKYEARNWEKGMDWSRAFGALQRHLTRWFHGQDKDKETRLTHLANAGCCLFFLLSWELRKVGTDDRPKLDPKVIEHMDNTDFMQSVFELIKQTQEKQISEEEKENDEQKINFN